MNERPNQTRVARLQRECDVSILPALLLSAACALGFVLLGLNALPAETPPAQAAEPIQQPMPPAT